MTTTDQPTVTAALWLERAEHCNPILPTNGSPMFAAVAEEMEEYAECKVAAFTRLASVSSASAEARYLIPRLLGHADYDEDFSDGLRQHLRDAARLLAASPEPVPATNQAGEVEAAGRNLYLLQGDNARMADALRKCRDQFAFYAREHYAAGKSDKGDTNTRFADIATKALEAVKPAALATQPATSQEGEGQHPDDRAVDVFAVAMKTKLAKAREKGRGGWDDPAQCSVAYLQQLLQEHIAKGDPVDVANFCMMLAHYGAPTTQRPAPIKCEHCRDTGFYDYAHFSIDPCNHCGDALAATPTPPTLSEDLREEVTGLLADYEHRKAMRIGDGHGAFDEERKAFVDALLAFRAAQGQAS